VDTGSIIENTLANFWIGLSNLSARALNLPSNVMALLELGAKRAGLESEFEALQYMPVMGLMKGVIIAESMSYLSTMIAEARIGSRIASLFRTEQAVALSWPNCCRHCVSSIHLTWGLSPGT
jgi:hypothetical protein